MKPDADYCGQSAWHCSARDVRNIGAGDDDFPIVGTYTENTPCTGDGTDVSRVTITAHDIDSVFGLGTILSRKREGATFAVHLECKGPNGNQMLGDVNFTPRDDL